MVKIVIIGFGRIAQNHMTAINNNKDVSVVGIFDNNVEKLEAISRENGIRIYSDCNKMLEELKPDCAVICVPTFAHEEYVRLCISHNVAVMCEKPLTRTAGSGLKLIEEIKSSGIIFMTAQVIRFWPGYTLIKKMVDDNEFGEIYMMHLRRVTSREDAAAKWLNHPKLGGGAIHDMLVHDVDYLRYICGEFDCCYANATKDESGCYNNIMANITCKNGVHAMAEASFTMQTGYPFSFSINIIGSKANLEYSYHAGTRISDTDDEESVMKIWREGLGMEEIQVEKYDAFTLQMNYFLDCVRERRKPEIITPDQTKDVLLMIDALHESAHTGTAIKVEEVIPFEFKNRKC